MVARVVVIAFALAALNIAANSAGSRRSVTCAIVGDSIAVGAGQHLRACKLNAKIGISSRAIIARVDPSADINVVSAGSNDPDNPALRENLERIRRRANRAIWILPAIPSAREIVRRGGGPARGSDRLVYAVGRPVHPKSEGALARAIDAVIARSGGASIDAGG